MYIQTFIYAEKRIHTQLFVTVAYRVYGRESNLTLHIFILFFLMSMNHIHFFKAHLFMHAHQILG